MTRSTGANNNPADRLRRYPPIALLLVGIFLAATILPSALNLVQPNPSQTLEYAPVPGSSEDSSLAGNLSSLGLGSGRGILGADSPESTRSAGTPGQGTRASTKRCVGNPPRQTDDPLSPPCVALFEGNNGGSTAPGVTRDEVRVVVYLSGHYTSGGTSQGTEPRNCGQYTDLSSPSPSSGEYVQERMLRAYARYFNDRYQTYGRHVRLFAYAGCDGLTPEKVRADASDNRSQVKPFTSLAYTIGAPTYGAYMAENGVLSFGVGQSQPASYYRKYPGLAWSYLASIEMRSRVFGSFACKRLVPHPVSFSGNVDDRGTRKFGLLVMADPPAEVFADDTADQVRACGGEIVIRRSYPQGTSDIGPRPERIADMAAFQEAGVTTILWVGGANYTISHSAGRINYQPEIIVTDPRDVLTNNSASAAQDPVVWSRAWAITTLTPLTTFEQEPCYMAAIEGGAQRTAGSDYRTWGGCTFYRDLRLLFTGIQVAGPRLTAHTLEQGFRAIPKIASNDPRVPACFYAQDDYTCVKDAMYEWWDPSGVPATRNPSQQPGCWRLTENGQRYIAEGWRNEDITSRKQAETDACNSW